MLELGINIFCCRAGLQSRKTEFTPSCPSSNGYISESFLNCIQWGGRNAFELPVRDSVIGRKYSVSLSSVQALVLYSAKKKSILINATQAQLSIIKGMHDRKELLFYITKWALLAQTLCFWMLGKSAKCRK